MTASRRLAAVATLAALLAPGPTLAAEPPGAATPQALVARVEAAAETQDLAEMMACIAPKARREMAMVLVAGAGMMIAFASMGGEMAAGMAEGLSEGMTGEEMSAADKARLDEGKRQAEAKAAELMARYEGILERHGVAAMMADDTPVPDDPAEREAALERMFANTDEVAMVADLMRLLEDVGEGGEKRSPIALPGEVTDYRVDGDTATAQAGEETLHFVRLDGRWYLEMKDEAPAAEEAPPTKG